MNTRELAAKRRRWANAYKDTVKGRLTLTYLGMRRQVAGRNKTLLYWGLPILSKAEFLAWASVNSDFLRLFEEWKRQGKPMKLSPCIDRIHPAFGYELWNMQFLTHGEHSRKANIQRHHGPQAA